MLGRSADNRVEPECWPHVEPGFRFTKDQCFFAIGSWFAKNISKRLHLDGYNVHGGVVTEGNRRNRYTPAAIYQELAWAKAIFDRDDDPREEDILPLLLELGPNRWTDIWSRPEKGVAPSLEKAIETRKELYAYFRGAFVADVVIITLGLIEAWWDEGSQSYVEFDTPWARREDKERFSFERLSFEKCRHYVEKTLDLIVDEHRRVLITTSPVALARTFTSDDIIIANNHSKSVLRAVAGEVSEARENVDYFPSYEIATITRKPEVWEDDLIHINPNFVARIMQHVTEAYVPGSVDDADRERMRFAHLVESRQFGEARTLYEGLHDPLGGEGGSAFHVAALRLAIHDGDAERAASHASAVEWQDHALYVNHPDWMFDVARTLRQSPEHADTGERISSRLWEECRSRPDLFQTIVVMASRAGDQAALDELSNRVLASDASDPILTSKLAAYLQEKGRVDDAVTLCERQLSVTSDHPIIVARLVRLFIGRGDIEKAAETARLLIRIDPENHWAKLTLARLLLRLGDAAKAVEVTDGLIDAGADDASILTLRACALSRLQRKVESREAALLALEKADMTEQLRLQLQPILQSHES